MKKSIVLLAAVAAVGLFLGGCGSSSSDTTAKKDLAEYKPYGKYKKPVTFTIGRGQRGMEYMPKGDTIKDNPATRFLTQETNIVPKVAWESANMNQKLSLSITTGKIPDVMVVGYDQFKDLKENGLLADLTEVYKKAASPNVKARMKSYHTDVLKLASDNSKLMAIPMPYYYYEHTLTWIRQDWLDKVHAKVPENIDQLHDLAKKFVDADLAGGGKTVGITLDSSVAGNFGASYDASPIFNQLGSYPRQWVNKNGKAVYGSIQPETKTALALMRQWYKEGIIDKQFAVRTDDERQSIITDKTGIDFAPWWAAQFEMAETVKKDPKAKWIALATPKGKNGKFEVYTGDPILEYVVVRKGYEHPEAIMRALNNITDFNFSLTKEAVAYRKKAFGSDTYFPWYYAPIDYKLENAEANKNDYNALKKAEDTNSTKDLPDHLKGSWNLIQQYKKDGAKNTKAWSEYAIFFEGLKAATDPSTVYNDMAYYGSTKTMETKWVNLKKLEDQAFLNIVMGQKPLSEFDKFVKTWKSTGGDQVTKEVQEEVAKQK